MRVLGNRNLSVIPVNSKGRNQCSVVDSVEAGRGGGGYYSGETFVQRFSTQSVK